MGQVGPDYQITRIGRQEARQQWRTSFLATGNCPFFTHKGLHLSPREQTRIDACLPQTTSGLKEALVYETTLFQFTINPELASGVTRLNQ